MHRPSKLILYVPNPSLHLTVFAAVIKSRKAVQGMFFGFAATAKRVRQIALALFERGKIG